MKSATTIIFEKMVIPIFSCVSLYGEKKSKLLDFPYSSMGQVEFLIDYVEIHTIGGDYGGDNDQKVQLIIYDGFPDEEDISQDKFCVSGKLVLNGDELIIDVAARSDYSIRIGRGVLALLIVLDAMEVQKMEVSHVNVYLQKMGNGSIIQNIFGKKKMF